MLSFSKNPMEVFMGTTNTALILFVERLSQNKQSRRRKYSLFSLNAIFNAVSSAPFKLSYSSLTALIQLFSIFSNKKVFLK